jgi:hypothetical protein
MYVIEGLDHVEGLPRAAFAIMTKIHHAAIDGVTLLEIMSAVNDPSPDAPLPEPIDRWRPDREPTPIELLSRTAVRYATRPMRMTRLVASSVPGAVARMREQRARQNFDLSAMRPAPRTRFNGPVTTHRVVEARRFDFDVARRIRRAVPGATINDVAITVVGGALRHYLGERGELPDEPLRVMARSPSAHRTRRARPATRCPPCSSPLAPRWRTPSSGWPRCTRRARRPRLPPRRWAPVSWHSSPSWSRVGCSRWQPAPPASSRWRPAPPPW